MASAVRDRLERGNVFSPDEDSPERAMVVSRPSEGIRKGARLLGTSPGSITRHAQQVAMLDIIMRGVRIELTTLGL